MLKREKLFNLSSIPIAYKCSLIHDVLCYGFHFKIQKISSVGQPFKLHCVSALQVQCHILSYIQCITGS